MKSSKTFNLVSFSILFYRSSHSIHGPAIYQITEPVDHSEEPTWDGRTNRLYYVDIHSGRIFAYHYDTEKLTSAQLSGEVTPVIPSTTDPNIFLVGVNRSVVLVEWDGGPRILSQKILATVSQDFPQSRFNDGKADSKGRLWWGKWKLL